jgi:hypothetical protein
MKKNSLPVILLRGIVVLPYAVRQYLYKVMIIGG